MKKIILASGSPRRRQLLTWAEIAFEVMTPATDESYPEHFNTNEIAVHIAKNKALAVQQKLNAATNGNGYTIIAADTIVVLKNKIIGRVRGSFNSQTHALIPGNLQAPVCLRPVPAW